MSANDPKRTLDYIALREMIRLVLRPWLVRIVEKDFDSYRKGRFVAWTLQEP